MEFKLPKGFMTSDEKMIHQAARIYFRVGPEPVQ
jgi:hypothetical protein